MTHPDPPRATTSCPACGVMVELRLEARMPFHPGGGDADFAAYTTCTQRCPACAAELLVTAGRHLGPDPPFLSGVELAPVTVPPPRPTITCAQSTGAPPVTAASASRRVVAQLHAAIPTDGLRSLAISNAGHIVVLSAATPAPAISLWDVETGRYVTGCDGAAGALAMSSDAVLLASANGEEVALRHVETLHLLDRFAAHAAVTSLAFNDKRELTVGCVDGVVEVWDVSTVAGGSRSLSLMREVHALALQRQPQRELLLNERTAAVDLQSDAGSAQLRLLSHWAIASLRPKPAPGENVARLGVLSSLMYAIVAARGVAGQHHWDQREAGVLRMVWAHHGSHPPTAPALTAWLEVVLTALADTTG